MTGVSVEVTVDGLGGLGNALVRMRLLGESPRAIWEAIGNYGANSTLMRFNNETGPDGVKWKPSARVKKNGGKTLQLKKRLMRSTTHRATNDGAEWGTNVIYAGIHQFGGKIERLAFSSTLRLRTGRGGALLRQKDHGNLAVFARATHKRVTTRRYTVQAHAITMPARPSLGVNADDGREMLRLTEEAIDIAARNRGGAV